MVLVIGMLPVAAFADEAPHVTLEADKTEVAKGETITLTMKLDKTIEDAYIWQWNIIWNSELFEAVSMAKGDAYNRMAVNANATITTTAPYKASSVTSGNRLDLHTLKAGTLCTLTLKAKEDISADSNAKFYIFKSAVETGYEDENYDIHGTPIATTNDFDWGTNTAVVPGEDAPSLNIPVKAETSVAVTGITLSAESLDLAVGQTAELTATVLPENATDKKVTWSVAGDAVTVDNGTVTAVAAGNATVTVTSDTDRSISASCAVTVTAPKTGYNVTMPEDVDDLVVGATVTVTPTITYTPANAEDIVNTYNAFDMTFAYDTSILELTSKTIDGMTVTEPETGKVRVQRYGADLKLDEAPTPLTLYFTAKNAGNTNVTLTSAKVDMDANSIEFDAPEANKLDAETAITVGGYTVILPKTGFKGAASVAPSEDYTFEAINKFYDYTFTVTMTGTETPKIEDNGNGTYTVKNVTGNITIAEASRTGKPFEVTLKGGDLAHNSGYETVNGKICARYGIAYTAKLTKAEGSDYNVTVEDADGNAVEFKYDDETGIITVYGEEITGAFTIDSGKTAQTPVEPTTYTVTFNGNAASKVQEPVTSAEANKPYTFRIDQSDGYAYTVTYTMGETTEEPLTGEKDEDSNVYTYTIDEVTANVTITVDNVTVKTYKYVEADGKTVLLVTANGTLDAGEVFAYKTLVDNQEKIDHLFYSNAYNAWAWLLFIDGEAPTAAALKTNVVITEGIKEELVTTTNVNMSVSGTTDINDAQLVYDIYTGHYGDFTQVNMQKFLNADVVADLDNADGKALVNVSDANAVVYAINHPASNS